MAMRTLLLGTATAVALAGMATSAQAADRHGWYFGLEGGIVKVNDNSHGFLTDINYEAGWAGIGTVGFAFNGHWRVELEAGMRRNEIDKVSILGFPPVSQDSGDLRNYTGMINAVWDAPISNKWALSLGLGIGGDHVRLQEGAFGFSSA